MAGNRRKLSNPLALAVLVLLSERPMHPYEIAQTLRQRGKEHSVKINFGSLYTVVQNLEKHGYVEVAEVQRQGNRPERTLYGLTDDGRVEMVDWMSDLLAVPAVEFPLFGTAVSLMPVLPPDDVAVHLEDRLAKLEVQAAGIRGVLHALHEKLPQLFLVETEYQLHMIEAEMEWVRGFRKDLVDGTVGGQAEWESWHRTGETPKKWKDLEEQNPRD
ncbi:PadR family transcriptional regulator [Streptomyces beijiangensis]|uniref:PadR family transcriptional regulator n=1 Tax=Streptomyces beijiangensis TaxID=163361 RepID=A0A939JL44_9ACTN|nr:PadR family transcriptional regulator [Streptomyces beijiangensis]MBO0516497.1 PadR family transcriptional regulator [Streptomyces beijiangensis]